MERVKRAGRVCKSCGNEFYGPGANRRAMLHHVRWHSEPRAAKKASLDRLARDLNRPIEPFIEWPLRQSFLRHDGSFRFREAREALEALLFRVVKDREEAPKPVRVRRYRRTPSVGFDFSSREDRDRAASILGPELEDSRFRIHSGGDAIPTWFEVQYDAPRET